MRTPRLSPAETTLVLDLAGALCPTADLGPACEAHTKEAKRIVLLTKRLGYKITKG